MTRIIRIPRIRKRKVPRQLMTDDEREAYLAAMADLRRAVYKELEPLMKWIVRTLERYKP